MMVKNVLQTLEETANRLPHKIAISDKNESISYADFVSIAKKIGSFFYSKYGTGNAIAVAMDNSVKSIVVFMGIVYSGNYYAPLDIKMPFERVKKILEILKPKAIVTQNDLEKWSLEDYDVVKYIDTESAKVDEHILNEIRRKSIDIDPLYVLFTSGSTGIPKGVICCHRSVINYASWLKEKFEFSEKDVIGNQVPFYFSMSVFDIYATIISGAELVILEPVLFAFPKKLMHRIIEKRINIIYWVPTAYKLVQKLKAIEYVKNTELKKCFFAGETMPAKILNVWKKYLKGAMFVNLFGPTEITDIGLYYIVDRELADTESVPIGYSCDNIGLLLLNEQNEEVKEGELGEICFRGSYLALGYFDNKESDEKSFVQNPLNSNYREIIYRTGDLGSLNNKGEIIFHGRKDLQIKHNGRRIELGEIEAAVSGVGLSTFSCCLYLEDKIVLFIDNEVELDEVIEKIKDIIPEYMLPSQIITLKKMPINANGKIDRLLLQEEYYRRNS